MSRKIHLAPHRCGVGGPGQLRGDLGLPVSDNRHTRSFVDA
jgi:hypothetical protein